MALDAKKWLVEELGFSEAEAAELAPKFNEERAKKLEGGYLRQSDYSKKMNEVGKAQKDYEAANERLNGEMAEWASLTASEKANATKLRSDLEKAQQDVLKYQQVVTRVATEAGLDPAKVMEGVTVVVPPKKEDPPQVDLSGYLKAEAADSLANLALSWPVEYAELSEEHKALTGQKLNGKLILDEIQKRARTKGNTKSLNPRQVWEELNDAPTLRAKAEETRINGLIAEAEKRGAEAARSEAAIPGQTPPGKHAPVFGKPSVLNRPQPGARLTGALAALREGKYRGKTA